MIQSLIVSAQDEDRSLLVGIFGGLMSYQGDLQPNNLSFKQSRPLASISLRKPLTNKFSIKGGFSIGKLKAADAFNRDYLKARNLSFYTTIKEAFLTLDYSILNISVTRFTPFVYGGITAFHFNPYTFDQSGQKIHLQPLSTEGQGLAAYSDRKPYKLTQIALAVGAGLRFSVSDNVLIGIDASQRKTFTDYLDDVSKSYADQNKLLTEKGSKAVELAYRGDEINGSPYPQEGEQRGTPTEMDWYYFAGISVEIKMHALKSALGNLRFSKRDRYNTGCPKVY